MKTNALAASSVLITLVVLFLDNYALGKSLVGEL
jgi:hypothetical protein